MKRVPAARLITWGARFLRKRGVPAKNARFVSRFIVETEAFRATTHGIAQFQHLDVVLGREVSPAREPQLLKDFGAGALFDGERTLGILSMKAAREWALRRAQRQGLAFAGVRSTFWVGALGQHLIPIAKRGYLAQAWAQSSGFANCAPPGGIDPRFSTNPWALAFPADGDPVVSDFSTSTMSLATARSLAGSRQRTSVPRFLDSEGKPSRDARVLQAGGSILFSGLDLEGHKFYGLSLFTEALAALCGGRANDPSHPDRQFCALLVLDPSAFAGRPTYQAEMKRFLAHLRTSRPRPGHARARLPGARGFAAMEEAFERGVPLDAAKLALLEGLARSNCVPLLW